jgi:glutamyl-tRNA reductase
MAFLALGISHRHAHVELLERLAFPDDDLVKAYRRATDDPAIEEAVILSTCNRVEVYGSVPSYHAGFQTLKRLLCESRGVPADELAEPLYSHYELDAAEHLFGVASGLDSMVIGEPQILSQVREALKQAQAEDAAGSAITGLFHAAARTGRRVRTETSVGAAPDTFVEAGAELGAQALGGLVGKSAVVIGAGQMSALAVKHLRRRDVGAVRILNRSLERARALAERTSADHGDLGDLQAALAEADIVVSATGAAGIVLTEETLRDAATGRTRPMFVLDLAVPRDVEPSAREIPNLTLADIDDLRGTAPVRAAATAEDLERAQAIVDEEVRRFALRRRAERLAPLIHALRERGDAVVEAEFRRFRSELADLTPDEREAVAGLARGVVAKLLHEPIVRLKELSGPGTQDQHARMLAELLGLELPAE